MPMWKKVAIIVVAWGVSVLVYVDFFLKPDETFEFDERAFQPGTLSDRAEST
jgi:hypothetical protein